MYQERFNRLQLVLTIDRWITSTRVLLQLTPRDRGCRFRLPIAKGTIKNVQN